MKHKNMTFSIPEDLKASLYASIGRTNISRFISNAVRKSLEEEVLRKEMILDAAYEAANKDADRREVNQEWDALDEISDLIDENENWDWLRQNIPKKQHKS